MLARGRMVEFLCDKFSQIGFQRKTSFPLSSSHSISILSSSLPSRFFSTSFRTKFPAHVADETSFISHSLDFFQCFFRNERNFHAAKLLRRRKKQKGNEEKTSTKLFLSLKILEHPLENGVNDVKSLSFAFISRRASCKRPPLTENIN